MADQWLLHTELMRSCIWLIHGYCTRSCMWLQYTTAAKELLRKNCCEGNAAKELLRTDCCERSGSEAAFGCSIRRLRTERIRSCIWLQYTTAAKELLRRGLLRRGLLHMAPAVLLLRRKCCEGNAEERTAAKKLLRTDCCEGDFCMRLCFTPAENGLLHTELIRSWSGAAHD